MIEMYPSYLEGPPLATYRTIKRMTIDAWLLANMDTYAARDPDRTGRLAVLVNGEAVPPEDWPVVEFGPDDRVRIHPAAGSGVSNALGSIVGAAFKVMDVLSLGLLSGLLGALTPSMSGSNRQQAQGDRLAEATIKTNSAKLNAPIREAAGRNRIYPDIILPARRYFAGPRDQRIDVLLCFGWGEYEMTTADLLIGDTRLLALGSDQSSTIYTPGADLSADPRAEWWHPTPEVGASSKGSPGLELRATYDIQPELTDVSELTFTDDVIFIPSGAGEFPEGWVGGVVIRIEQYLDYQVIDGTIIRGNLDQLEPFVGMAIEIDGDNAGLYRVGTYQPYSPAVPANPGSASTVTGSAPPAGFDFATEPVSFNVLFNAGIFPVALNADVTDMPGLVAALNGQLPSTIRASSSGGVVVLTEQAPYSGQGITISAGAVDVFGPSPITTTGTQTTPAQPEVPAQITLTFDDGSPVTGLTNGTQRMAIGYQGLLYRITAGGETSIAVERLTDTGAVDEAWDGFSLITTVDAVLTVDGSDVQGDWCGPFAVCPEGETVDAIEWEVFFQGGLVAIDKKGRSQRRSVTVELQWREEGTVDPWNTVSKVYSDATRDDIGFTEREAIPGIRPEVRMRRIGAKSTSNQVQDGVQWYGMRGRIVGAPTAYEGVTLAAITIAGGDRLAAQVERQISGVAIRKLPRLDGTFGATRHIADWVRYVCHSVGYTDDDINMAEQRRLHDTWAARGDYYDDDIGDNSTVKQVLNDALGAGFAELTVQRGLILPVRDEPRSTLDDTFVFSAQNYLKGAGLTKTTEMIKHDDYDGVDVEYLDPESWQWVPVPCRLPGDEGKRVLKERVQGIKDRDRAWRWGMRRRRALKYRRTQFSWSTNEDLFNCGYMGFVSLVDDVPGYGQSAIVEDVAYSAGRATVLSTEPLHWQEGESHVMGLRRPDGTLSGPYPATRIDEYTVEIDIPDFEVIPYSAATDIEPTHLQFGTEQNWSYLALIQDVSPNGPGQATGTAVNYDERVYADDNNFAPA